MNYYSGLAAQAAMVPAAFINDYMPVASGDYVKVYLYLLLNNTSDTEKAAKDLCLSEGDIKRALGYWEEKGVLCPLRRGMEETGKETVKKAKNGSEDLLRERYMSTEGTDILLRLSEDQEFSDLLFIVQKYRSKILNGKETEIFAYLYDGLRLPADVIEYLVAYSVEHDNNNINYMEKLGVDWAKIGIKDVESAKRRTKQFEEKTRKKPAAQKAKTAAGDKPLHTDYDSLMMEDLIEDLG